jgi:hypothetical protein
MSRVVLLSECETMTKKITPLDDYITAAHAAAILSLKHGRVIRPGYVHKLKSVRFVKQDATSKLYHRDDILACVVKSKHRTE